MMNATGSKDFYRLDPSLIFKDTVWATDAGAPYYNQKNPEKAKKLMKEAGYNGEPIRWLTTKHYSYMYNSAVVAAQQMQDVGFNVDLQVIDWATLIKRRYNPDEYEMFTTGTGILADPSQANHMTCSWAGWTCFEELDELMQDLIAESKFEERYATWKKMETFYYKHAVNIKFGDYFTLRAMQKNVKNYVSMELPFFWNVWLDK
jgi:peptide/nickel transport system substrate-binding protein